MEQPVEPADFSERPQDEGLRFARRMYFLRALGLVLGAVCLGGALWSQGAHALAWAALLANALVWPHIAYPLACRSANPYRAELRNLMVDSASGGAWMALIGFSPAPSAVIFSMMAMGAVSVGGLRFLARRVRSQNQTLAALSSIDGLSRLLNRSHWESVVASEFQRCRRIGHPSSVMMIDIDHFKAINDRHG